jgi:hypothetical protein
VSNHAIQALTALFAGTTGWNEAQLWGVLVAIAELSWFPVYFLIFREAYRSRWVGMPVLGTCAVLAQCFIYATFGPYLRPDLFPHNPDAGGSFGVVWVWRGWFLVQAFALYQLFKYHNPAKHRSDVPVTTWALAGLVAAVIGMNLVGQWTFISYFHDVNVNASDPIAYLFLAVGFVLLALNRPDHVGLSYPAAWLKLFATAVIYASTFVHPMVSYGSLETNLTDMAQTAREAVCVNPEANPRERCAIVELLCRPPGAPTDAPLPADYFAPRNCPPDFESIWAKRSALLDAGWRISGADLIFSTQLGEWDLIHTSRSDVDPLDLSGWRAALACLVSPPDREAPSWEPVLIPLDTVLSCVDGTIRVQYSFPLFLSIACVGCDALYVGILWRGRRRRRGGAVTAGA